MTTSAGASRCFHPQDVEFTQNLDGRLHDQYLVLLVRHENKMVVGFFVLIPAAGSGLLRLTCAAVSPSESWSKTINIIWIDWLNNGCNYQLRPLGGARSAQKSKVLRTKCLLLLSSVWRFSTESAAADPPPAGTDPEPESRPGTSAHRAGQEAQD